MALGLSAFDAAFAAVAVARPSVPARLVGAEPGFYADWGVGQLVGYAVVQCLAAVSPSRSRFEAVAALRSVAFAADLVAARHATGVRRAVFVAVAAANAAAAALSRSAAREFAAHTSADRAKSGL